MLKSLQIENFTVFSKADFTFSQGLNVVIGENGTGKSHLLKLIYSIIAASAEERTKSNPPDRSSSSIIINRPVLARAYAEKLTNVFRPESLGRLASRIQGGTRCKLEFQFESGSLNTSISFAKGSKTEVLVEQHPQDSHRQHPIFLPTRELLSIFPGFVALYDQRYLEFDETYRDTCNLLALPLKRRTDKIDGGTKIKDLLEPLEEAMGGDIDVENGRFYLKLRGKGMGSGKMEIPLVAEGMRKLAMIAYLIGNGALQDKGYLFWDEPEAMLNPRLIKVIATVIHQLSQLGIQIFVATHSYFLLKELQMLSLKNKAYQARYFSLVRQDNNVTIESGDNLDDIATESLVSLLEELDQFERERAIRHG